MREISLHLMDIIQNSIDAGADLIEIELIEDVSGDNINISIKDNGKGISPDILAKIKDPFITSRQSRKVGLGLSLFEAACVRCGGGLEITSKLNVGTQVAAWMKYSHIDRSPLGRIEDTIISSLLTPGIDITYKHTFNGLTFSFNTKDIKKIVGEDLNSPEILQWIKEYIDEGIRETGSERI